MSNTAIRFTIVKFTKADMLRLFTLLVICLVGCAWAAESSKTFEQSLSVDAPLTLEVDTSSGDINVSQSNDGQVHVRGFVKVNAPTGREAERLANQIVEDPPIETSGSILNVGNLRKYGVRFGIFRSVSISYEIEVPFETEVKMDSSSGDQRLSNLRGPVKADLSSGDVEIIDVVQAVTVDSSSGSISVTNVQGDVIADASSGSISVSDVQGDVSANASSGDVHITSVHGNLKVDVSSGKTDIDAAISEGADWTVNSSSGRVTLSMPAASSFNLSIDSSSGGIDLGNFVLRGQLGDDEVEGSVGENPSASIRIDTSSGGVQFQQQ